MILDVGVWSVGEGATQQQSGGVILSSGSSTWPVFQTWIKLHKHEYLQNYFKKCFSVAQLVYCIIISYCIYLLLSILSVVYLLIN